MKDSLGKTGNAPIVKVGQTYDNAFGPEPMAKAKGVASAKPTEQNFKG